MRAVGYRQVWETLAGTQPAGTLEARGSAATRQLAKRQLTWLRSFSGVETVLSSATLQDRLAHSFL
jgi:tRNA dimethylallyltransferase